MWCYDFILSITTYLHKGLPTIPIRLPTFQNMTLRHHHHLPKPSCGAGSDLNVGVKGVSSSSIIAAAVLVATTVPERTASKRVFESHHMI